MKLRQLHYLVAIVENNLNVTAAAGKVNTSQPGVSRQIRLLEAELGFSIFSRQGRALTRITAPGRLVVEGAQRVLREIRAIRNLSATLGDAKGGTLSIATTHTQARYVLPPVIRDFRTRYPQVGLHLHQGTSEQIAEMMAADKADFAIATGSLELFADMVVLPAYRWRRTVIVPSDHPLADIPQPTLQDLAPYPLITYTFSFNGASSLLRLFEAAGLKPNVALTARDADVIKTYVRLGIGVGILASVAVSGPEDQDLVKIDASHLFPVHTTWIGFRRSMLLRGYMYEFLQRFAPQLERRRVDEAREISDTALLQTLFPEIELPLR